MNAHLFDALMKRHKLKNDAALARFLDVPPPVISKQRNEIVSVGPTSIINIHEASGMTIEAIKFFLSADRAEPLKSLKKGGAA